MYKAGSDAGFFVEWRQIAAIKLLEESGKEKLASTINHQVYAIQHSVVPDTMRITRFVGLL